MSYSRHSRIRSHQRLRSLAFRDALFSLTALWSLVYGAAVFAQENDPQVRAALDRVYRDRRVSAIGRELVNGAAADSDAVRLIQAVLNLEVDSFSEKLASSRVTIEARLSSGTAEFRRRYDELTQADAADALSKAISDSSVERLRDVVRRYFLTSAGYRASEKLVVLWMDAGEYELACRLADRVLAEPAHAERIFDSFRSIAVKLRGIVRLQRVVHDPPTKTALEGHPSKIAQQFSKFRTSLFPLDQGWMLMGGSGTRSGNAAGSSPVPVPTWQSGFFRSPVPQEVLKDWEGNRLEIDQPFCPASYPIVLDGSVIFRDSAGIRSIDAINGATLWSFTTNSVDAINGTSWLVTASHEQLPPVRRMVKQRQRVSSETQKLSGDSSLMGAISSNGQMVFVVDSNQGPEPRDDSDDDDGWPRWQRNRLIALYARSASEHGTVAWINPGRGAAISQSGVSMGSGEPPRTERPSSFGFLGAPLPGVTELMSLTEHDDGIHLTGLEPRTGNVIWSQPLCTVDRNDPANYDRRSVACLPARAAGIVVCPTNTGLLVAVDQTRLNLMWATFVGELPDIRSQNRERQPAQTVAVTSPTFGSPVVIAEGRVVYLPHRSAQLHCLDLATGKSLWSGPRDGAEFIGAVTDGKVVLVGRTGCRALALEDGHELWNVPTGMPAGRGVALGNRYVQPLDEGRLAALDMATGLDYGTKVLRSKIALGHLAADEHRVYSVSHRGIVAFPQVDSALNEALRGNPQIARAEVAVVRGDLKDAERQFRDLLATNLSPIDRQQSRESLKELLFERVAVGTDITQADIEQLDSLLESTGDQFRFLIVASNLQGQILSDRLIAQFVKRGYQLNPDVMSLAGAGADWMISPAAWSRLQLRSADSSPFAHQIQRFSNDHRPGLLQGASTAEIQRFIRAFDVVAGLAPVRSSLATRLTAERSMHAAETLLLCNKNDESPAVVADATRRLAELWERAGFVPDAARQLQLLATTYAETRLPDGVTGLQYVRQLSSDRPAKRAWLQNQEPAWRVNHVTVIQTPVTPGFVQQLGLKGKVGDALESDRAEIVAPGRYFRTPIAEFLTSQTTVDDRIDLSIHDYRSRLRLGGLTIPSAHRLAGNDKFGSPGHVVPFGVPGGMLGVSTLQLGDEAAVWQQFPDDLAGRRTPTFPGPSGPEFASFTWRNRLYVVDPVDGALLWSRQIPLATQESIQNVRLEVIGDRRALGVMSLDRTRYDVFETATGRKLSTVVTGFVANLWQGAYGRFVMGYVAIPNGLRLQVRDLLKDAPDIDGAVAERSRPPILVQGELVYFGPGGEFKIYDIVRGEQKLSGQFEATEILTNGAARVLSDSSRYFVNLQRAAAVLPKGRQTHQWLNSQVPGSPARDDLYAIDRVSGEIQWKRTIPYRTILQFPDGRVPFLVTISQSKEAAATNAKQSLTIEVIDSQSGATIGYRENLKFDQLLSTHYDGESGRIVLRCLNSDIELLFGPEDDRAVNTRP